MLLKTAYIGLTLLMIVVISFIGFKTIDKTYTDAKSIKRKKTFIVLGLILWQIYIYLIAEIGILETYSLPPRFPIFLIIPTFVFTGIFIYKNRNNAWITAIKPKTLIYVQSFRVLVETIFVFSIASGVLHKNVTIEGYNMDMIFALTAPIIGCFAFKSLTKKIVILWNYLGLAVLVSVIFVFVTSIYFPEIYNSDVPLIPIKAVKYPFLLVAGFLMPLAVFIHVLSIVQLKKLNKE